MMKKYFLVVLAFYFWSCGSPTNQQDIDWTDKTVSRQSTIVESDTALFRVNWGNSVLIGDFLICCDFQSDRMFSIFQLRNDSLVFRSSFLNKGRGPNEMLLPILTVLPDANRLMIYEAVGKNKLLSAQLDTTSGNLTGLTISPLAESPAPYLTMCPLDTLRWIGIGGCDSMFSVIHIQDGRVIGLNPYPNDGCTVSDPSLKTHAYMGTLLKRPGQERFVYLGENNRYMLIFDYQGGKYQSVAAPYNQYPRYGMAADNLNISRDAEAYAGNLAVRATRKYVYLLMNDMTYKDLREQSGAGRSDWSYSAQVYVFDWDGNPVCKYTLDTPVQNILVASDDSYLYGISERLMEDHTTLLRFKL